jgi:vacuolar protein sorting-associated protein 11
MMLQAQPEETTDLLIDLCSGNLLRKREEAKEAAAAAKARANASPQSGGPNYLSYIGYDKVTEVFGMGTDDKPSGDKGTPEPSADGAMDITDSPVNGDASKDKPAVNVQYDPPSPRQYFAHFVNHRAQFTRFLETVAAERWSQRVDMQVTRTRSHLQRIQLPAESPSEEQDDSVLDQKAVWNTLLELYLTSESDSPRQARPRAIALLEQADVLPIDPMHALILCSTSNFTAGLIGLWERLGMYEDILRFWMQRDEEEDMDGKSPSENVIHHLNIYGPTNLHLYPLVLRYLTSSTSLLSRHTSDLKHVLQVIDEERIMPPLAVVQLLSRNNIASIGVVKDWLKSKVAETRQDVESVRKFVVVGHSFMY